MQVTVIHPTESVIYNGVIHKCGQSFDVEDSIGKSLIERGYVSAEGDANVEGHLDKAQLMAMSYPTLKRLAADMGVSAVGNKETLVARICAATVYCEPQSEVEADSVEGEALEDTADDLPNTSMPD